MDHAADVCGFNFPGWIAHPELVGDRLHVPCSIVSTSPDGLPTRNPRVGIGLQQDGAQVSTSPDGLPTRNCVDASERAFGDNVSTSPDGLPTRNTGAVARFIL